MAGHSTQRIAADNHFLRLRTQSLAQNRVMSERESIALARDASTAR